MPVLPEDVTPHIVDARGHRCPTPTLKLGRALRAAAPGAVLKLLATDPLARIDVPHFLSQTEGDVESIAETDGVLTFLIRKPGPK